jgi:hypothetical protein
VSFLSSPQSSQLIYEFQPLTPAGTSISSPKIVDMAMPAMEVNFIEWMVPNGPQGNLGWQLWYSNALVIPQNGTWIITDGEIGKWDVNQFPQAGSWNFYGYNSGSYDHTVYLRFLLNPLVQAVATLDELIVIGGPSDPNPIMMSSNLFQDFGADSVTFTPPIPAGEEIVIPIEPPAVP